MLEGRLRTLLVELGGIEEGKRVGIRDGEDALS